MTTHAQIAADARKPYADAIRKLTAENERLRAALQRFVAFMDNDDAALENELELFYNRGEKPTSAAVLDAIADAARAALAKVEG